MTTVFCCGSPKEWTWPTNSCGNAEVDESMGDLPTPPYSI